MAPKHKNQNFLIKEQEGTKARALTVQIANFFAKETEQKICIITKSSIKPAEAGSLFSSLTPAERKRISIISCKEYQKVLEVILELDLGINVSRVLIVESLHQWWNSTTPLDKVPSIYSTIFAAVQDTVNTNSRILNLNCYSFILAQPDELPTNIVELFFDYPIKGSENCISEMLQTIKDSSLK